LCLVIGCVELPEGYRTISCIYVQKSSIIKRPKAFESPLSVNNTVSTKFISELTLYIDEVKQLIKVYVDMKSIRV